MKHIHRSLKKWISMIFALAMVLALLPSISVAAEEGSYSKVSLTNAEAAAYEGTLYTLVNGSYEVVTVTTTDSGTAYIGNDGNTYTADEVSSQWTDSAGNAWGCVNYSTSVTYDYYVTSSLKTFTRSKSGIYYRYTLDGSSTTSTNKTSASDARSAFVTWVSSTYGSSYVADCRNNGDNYYAAAYIPIVSTSTVTAYTYSYSGGSVTSAGASAAADIALYVYKTGAGTTVNSGTFKVASLNVDGLPSSLSLAGGLYSLSMNSDGPGSDGTKLISQYVASSGIDLYSVQEDFDYNDELLSAISGIYTSGTFRGTLTSLASSISIFDYASYLNGSKHIDTDGLNILALSATTSLSNESIVAWNTTYGTTSNGNDQLVDKGYRFYNATINGVTLDVYILHMDAEVDDEDIAARESQMTQLANAIINSNTSNPILVIGDTNCRYTRDHLETLFMDVINAQENLTASDAWVELEYDGVYPEYGTSSLMASELGYQKGEIVDKVIYINNSASEYTLQAVSYTVDTSGYVGSDGTALGDHYPVIVEFSYTNADEETHVHTAGEAVTENVVAATCTTDGSYDAVIYCTECGAELSRETITVSATGHTAGEAVTENMVAATCTTDGSYDSVVYCSVCGAEMSREMVSVSAPGHSTEIQNAKDATCTEDGYTGDEVCTVCGETIETGEVIPATGHTTEVQNAKDATCTEDGYTGDEVCTVCGETVSTGEVISATGHTTEIQNAKEATCTEDGYTGDEVCTVCGETVSTGEVISATGHTTEIQNAKDATCTEDGYTGDEVCTVCGETIETGEVIPATGHTTEVQNAKDATCTENGYTGDEVCTVCGETVSTGGIIAATGHKTEIQNAKDATCTEDGYTGDEVCTICGETITTGENIPANGHNAGEAVVENEVTATATEDGSYDSVVYCTVCGAEISRETVIIPATGTTCETHSYGKWEGNYSTSIYRTCTVCGEQEVVDNPFTDLSDNDFYVPIVWASYYGITTGKTATTFNPNGSCTRAQIVTFLWRTAGSPDPETEENPFSDVDESSVYYKAILWAYENGITNGTSATAFSPDVICTRVQIVTFLWRFAGKPEATNSTVSFSDVNYSNTSDFYKAIAWASENAITGGYSDGTFRPTATCTRAQAVTFLYRYCTEV